MTSFYIPIHVGVHDSSLNRINQNLSAAASHQGEGCRQAPGSSLRLGQLLLLLWRMVHTHHGPQRRQALAQLVAVPQTDVADTYRNPLWGQGERREREPKERNHQKKKPHHDGDLVVVFKSHLDINPLSSQFP